ncbi:hypothetical protein C823_006770 [Eubacterium plexicaudatum ASF492]|nr:hypothetical protein C823_006770 [Eubacterium plexicaudatum ASF492]
MLSKPATMLLGFIYEKPLNAYEIIKLLNYMNVKWWFNIADSTVYSTLKTLEKKNLYLALPRKSEICQTAPFTNFLIRGKANL